MKTNDIVYDEVLEHNVVILDDSDVNNIKVRKTYDIRESKDTTIYSRKISDLSPIEETYTLPVEWVVTSIVDIKATSFEEAVEYFNNNKESVISKVLMENNSEYKGDETFRIQGSNEDENGNQYLSDDESNWIMELYI